MIRAEGVCKSFDKKEVLTDIDAVFEPGKVNLIIGKSGSGKTVLLKSLIGLHSIDKGKIFYNDRDITVMNNKQIKEIRKELGVVFQGGGLFDSLSVKKRVAIARAIVLQPKYLFCDEPNSGLDPLTSIVIDNLLSELTHEYDMTTVINTHDMNSVFEIGEKVLFIHEGHKEWEGSNEEIMYTNNKALNECLFSSKLNRMVREKLGKKSEE